MKRIDTIFLYIAILILCMNFSWYSEAAQRIGGNLLENPGFEEKGEGDLPKGWKIVPAYEGRGQAIQDTMNPYAGNYSLKITPNKKNTSEAFGVFMMLNAEEIKGKEITISGVVKVEGIGNNTVAILFKTDRENWVVLPKDTGGTFMPFSKTFLIAETIPEPGLLLLISGTKGSVWFDDLKVSEGKEEAELLQEETEEEVPTTEKKNLLKNAGFEESGKGELPKDWKIVPAYIGKGKAIQDKKNAHTGNYSLQITPNKKNTSEAFGVFQMLDTNEVQGQEITISGFVKVKGIGNNVTALLFKAEKENWLMLPKDTDGKFVPFKKTFSIAKSIPDAGLLLLVSGTKGSVWFDDLSVEVTQTTALETAAPDKISAEYVNKINTPGWQDSVFISPDGQELYFAYLPYVQSDFMDIFFGKISEKDVKSRGPIRPGSRGTMIFETYKVIRNKDGTWGNPIRLNINSTYSLYSAKLSHDGNELYYAIREYSENYGGDDIYVSKKLPDGSWEAPENLGPNINTRFREDTPCLTADGETIYFGRNKAETLGWEIMVSKRINGKWTKAEKLGPPINEPNPEKTANYQPFITADGKEFYFTRIQQLYVSRNQLDGSWGKPTKVFPQLPVSGHASVTDDGRYLYFLTAKDKESLRRSHWTIWYAERQKDGIWGDPKPVD